LSSRDTVVIGNHGDAGCNRDAKSTGRDHDFASHLWMSCGQFCAWLFSSQTIDFYPKGKTYENPEKFSVSVG
jgi:hypothetical protein